jgi:hypothetical protein
MEVIQFFLACSRFQYRFMISLDFVITMNNLCLTNCAAQQLGTCHLQIASGVGTGQNK